jgi:hypothetical protein
MCGGTGFLTGRPAERDPEVVVENMVVSLRMFVLAQPSLPTQYWEGSHSLA